MKKKLLAFLMGTSLVFGLAACGGSDDTSGSGGDSGGDAGGSETASAAEELYKSKGCAACHGNNLEGGVGSDLTAIGASRSQDEIKDAIVNGFTGDLGTMPVQNVSDDEANQLAEWLAAKK